MTRNEALTLARKKLRLSYRQAAELIAACLPGIDRLAPSRLLRWEEGATIRIPEFDRIVREAYLASAQFRAQEPGAQDEIVKMLDAATSGAGATSSSTPEILRLGLIAQPESALFAAIAESTFQGSVTTTAFRSQADLLLALDQGVLDVAICAQESLSRDTGAKLIQRRDVVARQLVKQRGSAVLVESGQEWTAFNQYYLENPAKSGSRKKRIRDALGKLLIQFCERNVTAADFYLPGHSTRMRACIAILDIGLESELVTEEKLENTTRSPREHSKELILALRKRLESNPGIETGFRAYELFSQVLRTEGRVKGNAIIGAGLSQRLQLEDLGAAPLIDCDDLQTISMLGGPRFASILFPVSSIVIHKNALQNQPRLIEALRQQWNQTIVRLREQHQPTQDWANRAVDAQMAAALVDYEETEHSWETGASLFDRLLQEQLLELLYWPADET